MKKILLVLLFISVTSVAFSYVMEKPGPALSRSLAFPVAGSRSNVGSFWGDVRDGGKRKHEGIDIFAKKGTPVVAVCSGVITSVATTPRGGKVVWLQSFTHPWSAYYAHLDQQKVRRGQIVKKGQVLGTVGNTGNARTTPSHLHFGIYTWNGAVNPFPYVKDSPKVLSPVNPKAATASVNKNKNDKPKNEKQETTLLPAKYVLKKIRLTADRSAQYYVTTRSNVVRIGQGKLQVIGKWKKSSSAKYPYRVELPGNQQLYVNKAGKLFTSRGQQVGTVS
jgi:murein DD-endopeptidase MepM/ murein hydrolase activator NlpD